MEALFFSPAKLRPIQYLLGDISQILHAGYLGFVGEAASDSSNVAPKVKMCTMWKYFPLLREMRCIEEQTSRLYFSFERGATVQLCGAGTRCRTDPRL